VATCGMSKIKPGVTVVISGLKGAAELNGKEGKCKDWNEEKGRWNVQLPGGELKALKPENLRPSATQPQEKSKDASGGTTSQVMIGGAVLLIGMLFLQQSGAAVSGQGVTSPTKYITELFEPFDPPPPKAPKDTVVISFCQG